MVGSTPGVKFINALRAAFKRAEPKSAKKSSVLFALLESAHVKAAHIILIRLTPGVNFINVKSANFSYKHRFGSFFSSCMYVEKRCSYEKFVRKNVDEIDTWFQGDDMSFSSII